MKNFKNIATAAKAENICKEWHKKIATAKDYATLCEMYFKGSDWSMEHDFPPLPILREHKDGIMPYGLHTDFTGTITSEPKVSLMRHAFFGDSNVEVIAEDFIVGDIYLRHNAKARILATDNAILVVNVLDSAALDVKATPSAQVIIYDYNPAQTNITTAGNVIIHKANFEK